LVCCCSSRASLLASLRPSFYDVALRRKILVLFGPFDLCCRRVKCRWICAGIRHRRVFGHVSARRPIG
jgi:hypothetical protein